MSVKDYIKAKTMAPMFPFAIYPSGGIAAGTVLCIALPGLAVAGSNDPIRIESSIEAAVHFEDTSPAAFSTVATPNQVAAPIYSAFNMDLVVVRLLCPITWSTRSATAASVVSSITW